MRLFELANELNTTARDLFHQAKAMELEIPNVISTLDAETEASLRSGFHRRLEADVAREDAMVRAALAAKAEAAAERLSAFSPDTAFETFPTAVTGDNAMSLVEKFDVVVDCCDNFTTRYILDEVCSACGKPLVFGAIGEYSGQVTVLDGRAGKRLSDLYPDRESLCSRPVSVSGVIGPVPGVIGSVQACETLKLLAGFGELLDGRIFVIDLLTLRSDIVDF